MPVAPGKFLTFVLGKEEYGLRIQHVKQIIGMMDITSVPDMPKEIKGIINLRGRIVPVVDLRLKFGMEAKAYTDRTCIIVVEDISEGKDLVGLVVDAVSDVANVAEGQIDPPPRLGGREKEGSVVGIGKVKGKVILILDVARLLSGAERNFQDEYQSEDSK